MPVVVNKDMETFRAIAKPEGLKFTPLFSEPLDSDGARIKRLEDAVQNLRNDFDTVVPSMVRLVAIEKDMKELVGQLQTLTNGEPPVANDLLPALSNDPPPLPADAVAQPVENVEKSEIPGEDVAKGTEPAQAAKTAEAGSNATPSSPVTPEAAPKGLPPPGAASPSSTAEPAKAPAKNAEPAPEKPAVPPPAVVAPVNKSSATPTAAEAAAAIAKGSSAVEQAPAAEASAKGEALNIRIGDHPDKTRLVIDLTAKADVSTSVSADGRQLVIDLKGLAWKGQPSWEANNAALVSGWRFEGGKLYVDLMGASTVKGQEVLPPAEGSGNYRLVIDLFCKAIHK